MWSSVGAQFTEYNYTLLDIATTAPIPNDYVFSQDEFTEDRLAAISEKDGEAALDVNVNIRGFNLRPPKVEGASANSAEEEEKESLIKKNRERKEEDEDDEVLEMESVLDYNSGDSSSLLNYPPMFFYQDQMGMTITSGIVTIKKDATNLIGISIGGGAPLCPCLYIVQVFDNTPAAKEGTLESGDELVGVNGASVKGKTKVEVAKMIQACKDEVQIKYNKLHADPQQGKTLDIVLKKAKHRLVENMSAATADALGLSRAILCNDTLVKKLEELEEKEVMYRGLVDHTKRVMKATLNLLYVYKAFGDAFAEIGVREPQPRASEAFRQFGDYHRQMEKSGIKHLRAMKPILADLGTYLNKAIPDTKLTIKKYADTKFEYLSYCLKVKEKDDEEYGYAALQEPLYRVETGNYEYRLLLRCRQEARARFARLRSDVLVKLELLDNKHVQHVVWQLQKLVAGLVAFHQDAHELIKSNSLFPIEMDLTQTAFQYSTTQTVAQYEDEDDELLQPAEEVREDTVDSSVALDIVDLLNSKELNGTEQLVATDDNLISTDPATSHFTNIDLGQGLLIPDLNSADAASLTTDFADFSLNSPSPVDLKPPNLDLQNLDDNDIPTGKLIGIE